MSAGIGDRPGAAGDLGLAARELPGADEVRKATQDNQRYRGREESRRAATRGSGT